MLPTVELYAEINDEYKKILILTGKRGFKLETPLKDRITGMRNMSFASFTINNLASDEYRNYKISISHTSLENEVESVTSLRRGGSSFT